MRNNLKVSIIISIFYCILIPSIDSIFANQIKKPKSLRGGPQKDWSKWKYDKYYSWRSKLIKRSYEKNSDDQILRRQKAILNGNKITTEIWNYGSISSPGNRVTDIIWEGLGYGYEFGPGL